MAEHDYIIVGAGSSGAALAGRLTDAGRSVLLLEAGGAASSIRYRVPAAFMSLWFSPDSSWMYQGEPEPGLNGRCMPIPRGRVVGGSSAINGMICNRGAPQDYDNWAAGGLEGWAYEDLLPYFRRSETNWRGASRWHGGSGPVTVSPYPNPSPHARLVSEAARAMGFSETDDFAGPAPEGFGLPDMNVRRGRRVSAADAYLEGRRPTLTVATRAQALRILIENGCAVGVEYLQGGKVRIARTAGEVILSGGPINTPQLLMCSGIGPADELRRHDIGVRLDQPRIGRDLEDQPGVRFTFSAKEPLSLTRELRADRAARAALTWLVSGRGLLAAPPLMGFFIVRTREGLAQPDMRMIVSAPMESRVWFPGWRKPVGPGLNVGVSLTHPRSRGSVSLASADPLAKPLIRYNVYSDPHDLAEMRRGFRLARELVRQPSLSRLVGDLAQPAAEPKSDDEVDAYLRAATMTTFHPIGSCRMGAGGAAPVDGEFRLRGIDNLRVVDTSVFPTQIGGNPNLPAMMLAERAADMLLERAPPGPSSNVRGPY